MLRTNLNTALIILVLLLMTVVSTGMHYHLEVERSNLESRFQRLDNYNESIRSRIDFLQDFQKTLFSNLEDFNAEIDSFENILTKLENEDHLLSDQLSEFRRKSAQNKAKDDLQITELDRKMIVLKNSISSFKTKQNENFNSIWQNIAELNQSLDGKEKQFTDFLTEFGTRKMKKNLLLYQTDNPLEISDFTKNRYLEE